jgi:DNA repair exonuclease SbcCD ATPase subunit
MTELDTSVNDLDQRITSWSEKVQVGEYERNRRLEQWRQELDGHKEQRERWAAEWVKISDMYREARMTLDSMATWQEQLEQQQRETSEIARLESNRMRALWDEYSQELEKRWKNLQVDQDQRWSAFNRNNSRLEEQLAALEELVEAGKQEIASIWRVQTAQSETIRRLPQIWMEAVEKAIAHDPSSRRQPALVQVREE